MMDKVNTIPELKALNSVSRTSIFRLFIYVVSVCQWTLDQLFDLHRQEVTDTINRMKPHSLKWYVEKARQFQYGYNLPPDSDVYDNTGQTPEQVENSRIVDYCAVVEQPDSRGVLSLRVKSATKKMDLGPLSDDQLLSFTTYMNTIKDAGVRLIVTTSNPDDLRLKLKIYYNPLVLDQKGTRLDGTDSSPITTAVKKYLTELPFNGALVLTYLVDRLQQIDGVVIPQIVTAEARYGKIEYKSIDVMYHPDSGYLALAEPLEPGKNLEFIPQSSII